MGSDAKKINMSELQYYFDAKQKDSKDSSGVCTKSRKVLALRDRLLTLSDDEFDLSIQTVNGLLDNRSKESEDGSKKNKSEQHDAATLYENTKAVEAAANTGKIDPI